MCLKQSVKMLLYKFLNPIPEADQFSSIESKTETIGFGKTVHIKIWKDRRYRKTQDTENLIIFNCALVGSTRQTWSTEGSIERQGPSQLTSRRTPQKAATHFPDGSVLISMTSLRHHISSPAASLQQNDSHSRGADAGGPTTVAETKAWFKCCLCDS